MRRRRSSFRKEKAIMLASSCLVLTALTVTGLYVRERRQDAPQDNVVDFTALEEEESLTMLGSQAGEQAAGGPSAGEAALTEGTASAEGGIASAEGTAMAEGAALAEGADLTEELASAEEGLPAEDAISAEASPADGNLAEEARRKEDPQGTVPEKEGGTDRADAGGEEAVAVNASDAIAGAEDMPEDKDAMSASTLLDFTDSDTLVWPIVGNVLVNYSMDKTVYFATLDQYKYSPAIVISAVEGESITAAADGQVTDIYQDPETGTTVVTNLGDGYELTYGQLADLAVSEGDIVAVGDLIGSVAAPTMYYSVEGTNVYFKLTKDGVPVDPMSRLG